MASVASVRKLSLVLILFTLTACREKKAPPPAEAPHAPSAAAVQSAEVRLPAPKHNIFLMMEYRNEEPEYVHSAWFADTEGNEYRFSSQRSEDDVLAKALADSQLDAEEVDRLIAASKPQPKRVSASGLAQALKARDSIEVEPAEAVSQSPCNEIGKTYLFAYVLEARLGVLTPRFLREEQCAQVINRNPSPGASALADWLENLGKPKLLPI